MKKDSLHSEESKRKMSLARIGRSPWNKGLKGVQVAWNKGNHMPEEQRQRMVGHPVSQEARRKIGEAGKGKTLSEEHKRKLSKANKGRKRTKKILRGEEHPNYGKRLPKEIRLKISATKKGRTHGPHSAAVREKIRAARKGWKPSEQTRLNMSISARKRLQNSEDHPLWRGGISCEPYCEIWLDKEYKESIKARDNYECQNPDCWGKCNKLTLHHINYVKKDCYPLNLITLCKSCNARANTNRQYWQELFEIVLNEKESKAA